MGIRDAQPSPSPQTPREVAIHVVRTLRDAGHVAYFAGGCVRDELLGITPADYDVATDATPERVSALFRRTAHVGAHFGVVLVKGRPDPRGLSDPIIEVATFRADGAYSDRRRPDSVTFSDARSDAQRRDFTVNALFLDPLASPAPSPDGGGPTTAALRSQVVDFVAGLPDLDARILRAVGDPEARLAEDHLRALRAVRLSARLALEIEPRTRAAISSHARDLQGVSPERIGDEMRRILGHPTRGVGIALLQSLGLDSPVLGASAPTAAPTRLGGLPPQAEFGDCLAAMALDRGDVLGPSDIQPLLTRWRRTLCLSNDEREAARDVLDSYFVVRQDFATLGVAAQKRAATARGFEGAMRLLHVDTPAAAQSIVARIVGLAATPSGLAPAPILTGNDLIAAGMTPGPAFSHLLSRLYDAQLEDLFASREDGLALARTLRSP